MSISKEGRVKYWCAKGLLTLAALAKMFVLPVKKGRG